MSSLLNILRRLSEAHGPPGLEDEVAEIITNELKGHVDEIVRDPLGNIVARKGSGNKTLMIAAHMDEIALIVKSITDKGFIKFAKLGGMWDQLITGQHVVIHGSKGRVRGIIGSKAVHVMKEDERKQLLTYEKMFVDVGAKSLEEVKEMGIEIGNFITIDKKLIELANDLVAGKAFDDRAGCAALIQAIKEARPKCKVYAAFTTQEEVGLRGATVAGYSIKPTVAIAVDTTIAGDHPGMEPHEAPTKVNGGPVIVAADGRRDSLGGGLILNPKVKHWIISVAEELKIPYQLEVFEGGTTDATAIQLSREGVPSGVIAFPTRYVHTFQEVLSLKDLERVVMLLKGLMESEMPF
ncbi:MAG: M42 family metallopeptidase [Candidatus Nezhaarchaeota archaeon]|nr:M42 family metallopeptidase [Candidatus Nezhaarchaeota archaeon]MCX8141221.1 M42 family metallopeptidase [Candidatus Nezhaarchaeota archaeon]MDW8049487.1 M42 family metallopeptidase [Nitrososphaerota archaeon]